MRLFDVYRVMEFIESHNKVVVEDITDYKFCSVSWSETSGFTINVMTEEGSETFSAKTFDEVRQALGYIGELDNE